MQHTRPNMSKSGLIIGERQKSGKILNYKRSLPIVACKIISHNRLVGGADEESVIEETPVKEPLPKSVREVSNASSFLPPIPPTSPSFPAEKLVEDSARFEYNSKNMQLLPASGPQTPGSVGDRKVDEIIKYVYHNLEEAGKALATLSENFEHHLKLIFVDILGRIKQWTGIVQNKLDTCKIEIDNLRNELIARGSEIEAKTRELKDLKAQVDYQKVLNDKQKQELKRSRMEVSEDRAIMKNEKIMNGIKEINGIKTNGRDSAVRIVDRERNGEKRKDQIDEEDEERAFNRTAERIDEDEEVSLRRKERRMKDITYTNAMIQTVQEEEKTKRESELESEVIQLRKEYDRAMKERTEYESAIQRALLRGVSSLNVEALRVLRGPPIPSCTPCVPCPATTKIIPPEPVVPCPSTKRNLGSAVAMVNSAKVPRYRNMQNNDQIECTTKQSFTGPCCSVNRNRKSTNNGMIFLLHQNDAKHLDAPDNVCNSILKKIKIPPLPSFG